VLHVRILHSRKHVGWLLVSELLYAKCWGHFGSWLGSNWKKLILGQFNHFRIRFLGAFETNKNWLGFPKFRIGWRWKFCCGWQNTSNYKVRPTSVVNKQIGFRMAIRSQQLYLWRKRSQHSQPESALKHCHILARLKWNRTALDNFRVTQLRITLVENKNLLQ
jgi:hypothetical protein